MMDVGVCMKTLDPKGYCVFCLRKVDGGVGGIPPPGLGISPQSKKKESGPPKRSPKLEETIPRFCKLIGRYLNADFVGGHHDEGVVELIGVVGGGGHHGTGTVSKINDQVKGDGDSGDLLNERFQKERCLDIGLACHDCCYVMEGFCQTYLKLEEMELMLQWQVRKLKDIVASSARAPTRVRGFQKELVASKGGGGKLKEIEGFRKDFLRKCTRKFQTVHPRIHLKRKRTHSGGKEGGSKRRLPGFILGEGHGTRKVEDSQPIVDVIIKQEPGVDPIPAITSSSSEAVPVPSTPIVLEPEPVDEGHNNAASPQQDQEDNFADFDAHDDHMDIEYEYSSISDKKILAMSPMKVPCPTSSPPKPIIITATTTVTAPLPRSSPRAVVPSKLDRLTRLATSLANKITNQGQGGGVKPGVEGSVPAAPTILPPPPISTDHQDQEITDEGGAEPPPSPAQDTYDEMDSEMDTSSMAVTEDDIPKQVPDTSEDRQESIASASTSTADKSEANGMALQVDPVPTETVNDPPQSAIHLLRALRPPPSIVQMTDVVTSPPEPKKTTPTPEKGPAKKQPICSMCDRAFASPALLAQHMYTHADPKSWPFHCKYCNQRFYRVADFKRHRVSALHMKNKKIHKMNKPFASQLQRRGRPPIRAGVTTPRNQPGPVPTASRPGPTPANDDKKNIKYVRIIYRANKDSAANANASQEKAATVTTSSSNNTNDSSSNATDKSQVPPEANETPEAVAAEAEVVTLD